MTISNSQVEFQYAGNGVTTTFGYANVFFVPTDLLVELSTSAGLVSPAPVLNGGATYDYTVTGTQDPATGEYLAGGSIVFNNAPPTGDTVTISLNLPFTQNLTLVDGAKNPSASVNAEFDRLTLMCLQLKAALATPASTWSPFYDPAVMPLTPPAPASFTLAQGTDVGALATLAALNSRGMRLFVPAHTASSVNLATALQATVGFHSVTALVHLNGTGNTGFHAGVALGDASGKLVTWGISNSGLQRSNWTNINTHSADSTPGGLAGHRTPIWLQIALVSTNLVYSYSLDGENWITELTEAASTFLATITEQGIALDNESSAAGEGAYLNCYSFVAN